MVFIKIEHVSNSGQNVLLVACCGIHAKQRSFDFSEPMK